MSLFADILDVHTDWLTKKKYDQANLGLTGTSEDMLNRLEDSFCRAVCDNFWARKSLEFEVPISGRFGRHGVDRIDLVFRYRYDPKRIKLDLISLRASMGEANCTRLIIGNSRHLLPSSPEIYQELQLKKLSLDEPAALSSQQSLMMHSQHRTH